MPTPIPAGVSWRKSSFSGNQGDSSGCVEVAFLPGGGVAIRDTKDRTVTPHHYTAAEWDAFVAGVGPGSSTAPDVPRRPGGPSTAAASAGPDPAPCSRDTSTSRRAGNLRSHRLLG